MGGYEDPVFVEDIVRNAAVRLRANSRTQWFRILATNQESIHNSDAFAQVTWTRPQGERHQ